MHSLMFTANMAAKTEASPDVQVAMSSYSSGLMHVLKPSIEALDDKVNSVRQSQVALREQIDRLSEDLVKLSDCQDLPVDLEPYVKKLIGSRRRITLVNSVLQNAQERLKRLNQTITRETSKKRADMDPSLQI